MKKEKFYAYHDKEFADKTRDEIKQAKEAAQKLLDVWNGLNLPPFKSMFQLVHDPGTVYSTAVCPELVEHGKYQLSPGVSLKIQSVPVPNELYLASRQARNHTIIGHPDLFTIENDKTVVVNESESERLIHVNDIFTENEAQAQFARDVVKYVELSNGITQTLMALPTTRMPAVPFSLTGKFFPHISCLKLETEYLQEILKAL